MANKVYTISRQYGGGGHSVAEALSEKLGIPYYDQDIIAQIAVESGYSEDIIKKEGENMESGNAILNALRSSRFETNKQDVIWDFTKKVIRELAEKESCIIIGRCSNYILRKNPDLVSVFLYADDETRAERVKARTGNSELPTKEELVKMDKRRAAYYTKYTDYKWSDAQNYTISLNTGKISIDKCVDIIAGL